VGGVRSSGSVRHVVLLSSIGAQHASGTGIVVGVHRAEQALGELVSTGVSVTAVRAAYFMENYGDMLGAVLGQGVLPNFMQPDTQAINMVATADIGDAVVQALQRQRAHASGVAELRVVELSGPAQYSPQDAAAILSRLVGRPVALMTQAPEVAMSGMLQSFGYSAELGDAVAELAVSGNRGLMQAEAEGGVVVHARGVTPLEAVLDGLVRTAKALMPAAAAAAVETAGAVDHGMFLLNSFA
jgi:uncharacterized protein YbjT (DUF2867 family)